MTSLDGFPEFQLVGHQHRTDGRSVGLLVLLRRAIWKRCHVRFWAASLHFNVDCFDMFIIPCTLGFRTTLTCVMVCFWLKPIFDNHPVVCKKCSSLQKWLAKKSSCFFYQCQCTQNTIKVVHCLWSKKKICLLKGRKQ